MLENGIYKYLSGHLVRCIGIGGGKIDGKGLQVNGWSTRFAALREGKRRISISRRCCWQFFYWWLW